MSSGVGLRPWLGKYAALVGGISRTILPPSHPPLVELLHLPVKSALRNSTVGRGGRVVRVDGCPRLHLILLFSLLPLPRYIVLINVLIFSFEQVLDKIHL